MTGFEHAAEVQLDGRDGSYRTVTRKRNHTAGDPHVPFRPPTNRNRRGPIKQVLPLRVCTHYLSKKRTRPVMKIWIGSFNVVALMISASV